MSGQGIAQILVYAAVLVALGYPLGLWMARVYTRRSAPGVLPRRRSSAASTGSSAPTRASEQDWKSYGKTVLVFSSSSRSLLYAILRLQGHLFLNPDDLKGVPSHISLNTTASFVTNTNWQYYGGEYTMSYLSQMAGLAVQNFVSAAVGMAVLVAVVRGLARRSRGDARQLLGRPLPLARLRPAAALDRRRGDPDLAGRAADVRRARDRDDARRARSRRSRAARSRRRSRSSSSGRTAAASTTRTRPSRSRTRTGSRTSSRCSRSC